MPILLGQEALEAIGTINYNSFYGKEVQKELESSNSLWDEIQLGEDEDEIILSTTRDRLPELLLLLSADEIGFLDGKKKVGFAPERADFKGEGTVLVRFWWD